MTTVTPETNFIELLDDLIDYLKDDHWWESEELLKRCKKALEELENFDN